MNSYVFEAQATLTYRDALVRHLICDRTGNTIQRKHQALLPSASAVVLKTLGRKNSCYEVIDRPELKLLERHVP